MLQEILKFIFCLLVPLFYYSLCFHTPCLLVNIEKTLEIILLWNIYIPLIKLFIVLLPYARSLARISETESVASRTLLYNEQKGQVNTYLQGRVINAILEHRVEATNSVAVSGVGMRLQSGDLAVDMRAAQLCF